MIKVSYIVCVCSALLLVGSFVSPVSAEDKPAMPPMPKPEKEHAWLEQLAGEWDSEAEMTEPGKPPAKCKGTESARRIGGFWLQAESRMIFGEQTMTGILTLGYDAQAKKYVGTWIDSMTGYMWKYEGTVDAGGKVLTLNTEGPRPDMPGKLSKFRETIEIKDKDHKVFSSSILGEDGKWTTFVTVRSTRKK
jgi:hypothetical protein